MNYNPAALKTCTLEKEETYSEICVELTTTSDEHQLTHYWALLERALTAPSFSGKSGLSQLSLVTPTAFTHTLTNPPNLCCWLCMNHFASIKLLCWLPLLQPHPGHNGRKAKHLQSCSNNLSNSEQPISRQAKQSAKSAWKQLNSIDSMQLNRSIPASVPPALLSLV